MGTGHNAPDEPCRWCELGICEVQEVRVGNPPIDEDGYLHISVGNVKYKIPTDKVAESVIGEK